MKEETNTPLLIFPEGTTTSGRHLIKFKRGAFDSLLPIKPYVIKTQNKIFDTSTGGFDLGIHFVLFLCFLYHSYEIIDMPVIEPNGYIFKDAITLDDKVDIFIETSRKIMSEVGNFEISDKGVRDNFEYTRRVENKPIKNIKKYD